ncbi:hypothetical protein AJ79_09331 [Helicocarpus griseus UAMH5409]|uniref:FAD-binding PCMH-type domain-containing protein n=1 Tax=Helicocarpus griseus UAMH5409 TaxID=1447875 RepID=A0A2B7WKT8_9EURO|nr:hypothetical protein AJ79_09331 [Helicocarpus griseus UAMH5409]
MTFEKACIPVLFIFLIKGLFGLFNLEIAGLTDSKPTTAASILPLNFRQTFDNVNAIVSSLQPPRFLVHKPGEEEYERSVATANLLYRFTRPICVVQPELPSDVQFIVKQAKSQNVSLTIKNGGHSYAGYSSSDNGISLDLIRMRKVSLDMESKVATIQGGAVWGHVYKQLVNGHHDGYVVNGGRCPYVGVSGFTLGGGLSPFTRSFGMGCDTLKEATLVTADGELVTVKDSDDPKSDKGRLFWALCGAGGANFGVVVELKMAIQKLRSEGGIVVAGRYTWFPDRNAMDELLVTMNDFYTTSWPHEMTIDSSWVCDLQQNKSDLAVRFISYYDGSKEDFDNVINKNIKHKDLAKQLTRRSLDEKSTRFFHETLVAQWSEETIKAFPDSRSYSLYSGFVFKNDRDRIEAITSIIKEEMANFRKLFKEEQGLLQVTFIHSGGQASKKKRSASAFRWRDCVYHSYIWIRWDEKWLERDMRGFLDRFRLRLRPYSMMKRATFINFPDGSLKSYAHEKAYYGNNRQELQRIKQIWDKDNYFNWKHSVRLPEPKMTFSQGQPLQSRALIDPAGGMEHDEEGDTASVVAEEHIQGESLTDAIAAQQWESFDPVNVSDFAGILGVPGLLASKFASF